MEPSRATQSPGGRAARESSRHDSKCFEKPFHGKRDQLGQLNYISGLVFAVLRLIGVAIVAPFALARPIVAAFAETVWLLADLTLA